MYDLNKLYDLLENEILPTYYDRPDEWRAITQQGMEDVRYAFASDRMADEYYRKCTIKKQTASGSLFLYIDVKLVY